MGEKKDNKDSKKAKRRKIPTGPLRDKERTMGNLLDAVGNVIRKKGYRALTGEAVAAEAGVDRRLVWTYFGSVDGLLEAYFARRDFWRTAYQDIIAKMLLEPQNIGQKNITTQLDRMMNDESLQQVIQWEIVEKHKSLRKLADEREMIGEHLFKIIEPDFQKEGVDIRPNLALLIGGIYYLALHARINGSLFCGLDINKAQDLERLEKAIEDNIKSMYKEANVDK